MPYFRVIIQGKGMHIAPAVGGDAMIGFYTTRAVRAKSAKAAETAALALVSDEWAKPPLSRQYTGRSPELGIEQVHSVSILKALLTRNKGYTFYCRE